MALGVELLAIDSVQTTNKTVLAAAAVKRRLDEINFCNLSAATITVDVMLVPAGETAGADPKHYMYKGLPLVMGETKTDSRKTIVPVNGTLVMVSTGQVAVQVSGVNEIV